METGSPPPSTILRPPWLGISRFTWLLLTLAAFALSSIGIIRLWSEALPACTTPEAVCAPYDVSREDIAFAESAGLPAQGILNLVLFGLVFPKLAFGMVGLLIFWRRSNDWVAQLFSLMLTLFAMEGITNLRSLQPLGDLLYFLAAFIFGLIPFIFPDGRFVPAWTARYGLPVVIMTNVLSFLPQMGLQLSETVTAALLIVPWLAWFIIATYAVVYRYRFVSGAVERQQIKWAISGLLASFVLFIPLSIIAVYFPPSEPSAGRLAFLLFVHYPLYFFSYLGIPAAIAFSILRYRLWDIDVLIRRTLQYTLLTGLLALIYFGGVVVLQGVLGPLTGDANSPLVTVITTLGIAALFTPLRTRVQLVIDRRFFRAKYNAEQTLERFAAVARDEVDLEKLSASLVDAVDEAVRPERVALWLKT